MADEESMLDKVVDRTNAVLEKPVGMVAAVVNFFMRDGSIAALGREAVKDVQDTFYQAAFGQADHSREPGGPLTPLFSDIAEARDAYSPQQPLPSPSQIANDDKMAATVHGPAQEAEKPRAMSPSEIANEGNAATVQGPDRQAGNDRVPTPGELAQDRGDKAWADYVTERREKGNQDGNTGNDQNARAEERSLADEQRERDRGRER